jgi:hypothetical protein
MDHILTGFRAGSGGVATNLFVASDLDDETILKVMAGKQEPSQKAFESSCSNSLILHAPGWQKRHPTNT